MLMTQSKLTQADDSPMITAANEPGDLASDEQISRLIGQLYAYVPAVQQKHLIEHLLNPLGALARVTVAHGVFAECLFRSGWRDMPVRLKDAPTVRIDDVIELVDYVQKVSVESVDALGEMIKAWPLIASSVTSGALMTELIQRAKRNGTRCDGDD